jgi:glutamine amidotransferase
MNLSIIQYNAGNIQSVLYALERLGVTATVTDDPSIIQASDKVIFPGVGEASTAMTYLKERNLDQLIVSLIDTASFGHLLRHAIDVSTFSRK